MKWLRAGWDGWCAAVARAGRAVVPRRWRAAPCPHPPHRIRHIHGDERNYGYVAECMECCWLFRDWPGGHHDATRCYTLRI